MDANAEIERIGTKVVVTMPDGKKIKFSDYCGAINFINSTSTKIDTPIGIPDFFLNLIDKNLMDGTKEA